ncbi:hypothetical protein HanHA89_Chr10g0397931 [Helianthus annuus]|nr:hypothetical protein HanHA89_Chr10g0397931 [Helianthus annuus]
MLFDMIGGSILVTSRLQAVVLRMVDFGGVTYIFFRILIKISDLTCLAIYHSFFKQNTTDSSVKYILLKLFRCMG